MPYIKQEDRVGFDDKIIQNAGELNYIISTVFDDYINNHGLSYATINTIIGAIECAKLELYRRIAVPYEDYKFSENGEVYNYAKDLLWNYSSTEQRSKK